MMLRLMQVINVGTVLGGTGACAECITLALPNFSHSIYCLGSIDASATQAFKKYPIFHQKILNREVVRDYDPDIILFHNTGCHRVGDPSSFHQCSAVTIQYHHSAGPRLPADIHVSCSGWLSDKLSEIPHSVPVLYQPVYGGLSHRDRHELNALRVGRICTPRIGKWPTELISFYEKLAEIFPQICWEFVGCPVGMQTQMMNACQGNAWFYDPGISGRNLLSSWDVMLYHHPTLTETFGRVCAEAMRAGCIPVVDDRGGFCEQVAEGAGFKCRDIHHFVASLKILGEPEARRSMSQKAKRLGDSLFGESAFRREFLSLIHAASLS